MAVRSSTEQVTVGLQASIGGTSAVNHIVPVNTGSFSATETFENIMDTGRRGSEALDLHRKIASDNKRLLDLKKQISEASVGKNSSYKIPLDKGTVRINKPRADGRELRKLFSRDLFCVIAMFS